MYEQKEGYMLITIDSHLPVDGSDENNIKDTLFRQFKLFKRSFSFNAEVVVLPSTHCIVYKFLGIVEVNNRVFMQIKLLGATDNFKFIEHIRRFSSVNNIRLGMFKKFSFIDNIPSSEAKYDQHCCECGSKIIIYVQFKFRTTYNKLTF